MKAKAGMSHSDCGWTCGCAGKTEIPWEHVPPERFCVGDSLRRGAISSVWTFTFMDLFALHSMSRDHWPLWPAGIESFHVSLSCPTFRRPTFSHALSPSTILKIPSYHFRYLTSHHLESTITLSTEKAMISILF